MSQSSPPASVRDAIDAFARGEIVVVTDDDDRENEGDLIIAAVHTTPEKMAFIIRHTCGIVCAPVTGEIARRLHLAPMVADSDAIHGTAFTISVDYRHGTTTGISADDRTATIRALANGNAGRADFVRPGHVFPLIAKDGGVLMRSGHTEAAIDLCRLAAIEPVAAICELVNDDGAVMRGPQVAAFARKHALQRIAVADLIAYRQAREKLVTRVAEFGIESESGAFRVYAYVTPFDKVHHFAFVYGEIGDGCDVPTRLHRANVIEDVFGGAKPIHAALARFKAAGRGVLVYLREGTSGVPTTALAEDTTASELERSRQWREVGLGAQILRDLRITSIRLYATRSRTYVGLAGFGIEIASTEPLEETSSLRLIVGEPHPIAVTGD
ncbi:MAG TPA: 3,4-dihydroxy-2-butanone-4-phosphate synthase [Stellaceae bacterium]|nr:3,4-dihydroxy-2-butanone-4-phosphate synthase [Stellaceae bacterium]